MSRTKSKNADERQAALFQKFVPSSFLGNEKNVDHFLQWNTFFRRNMHRFAMDYLGLKLHPYQIIMLYLMGVMRFFVVIASRASAKSFIIALYCCCKCILYPNSMIVLASGTKGQSKLMVSEKIEKELMNLSPVLRKEIRKIKNNQNEVVVYFRNHSTITVVTANDNARGYRSTAVVREEFRQIKKYIDDSVLSPYQISRQAPYIIDEYYANIPVLQEEPVDIYISSSWFDNGHWMWNVVDQAYDEMMRGSDSFLLAFDESIALMHKIKTMRYFQSEKKKQDPITWKLEFLNYRLKENQQSFFSYGLLQQNQVCKQPFYPRMLLDLRSGKKNQYDIAKQAGEIRVVACDMAFVTRKGNDNSVFSCIRLLPEKATYKTDEYDDVHYDNGYRRIVSYIESCQGGDVDKQSLRIRQLFNDFLADYIVLDLRNAGIAIYDKLAKIMYDEERRMEYPALSCMNDDSIAARIRSEGATPCIYVISASQKLNSDIALDFRRVLSQKKIDLLVQFEIAQDEILPKLKDYNTSPDAEGQLFFEIPFLETQALISECVDLVYEKKEQTGAIVIHEQSNNTKDRYTSVSYGSYFASLLEQDIFSNIAEYEYCCFVN